MGRPSGGPGSGTKSLTAQQRHDIKLLFFTGGLSKPLISKRLNVSLNQVKYALRNGDEPRFSARGVKPKLNEDQTNKLLAFLSANPGNRRLSYAELSQRSEEITGVAVGPDCIRSTLRRHSWVDPTRPPTALRKKRRRADAQKDPQPATASREPDNQPTEDPSPSGGSSPQPAQEETSSLVPECNMQSPPDEGEESDQTVNDCTSIDDDVDDNDDVTMLRPLETCDQPEN